MLYKFDRDGHGAVIAEDKVPEMESYLGLHFPESDIPVPARKLFLSNWIRMIPNTHVEPVKIYPPINPISRRPVDLTLSSLRSAYSCHIEYLHNMGVGASLTISLMKERKLWGLIACHHRTPLYVAYELRKACEFLGRMIFSEIASWEETEDYDYRVRLSQIHTQLLDFMAHDESFVRGLTEHDPHLLDLTDAQGAAIVIGDSCTLLGQTPEEEEIIALIGWLKLHLQEEVLTTSALPSLYPEAEKFKDTACGLLAIPISDRNFVLWFRPEVLQTIHWGGDPRHALEVTQEGKDIHLHPRKSFQMWQETVQLQSLPWKAVEVNAALELRKAIINLILRQADELAQLAQDLERSNGELPTLPPMTSRNPSTRWQTMFSF